MCSPCQKHRNFTEAKTIPRSSCCLRGPAFRRGADLGVSREAVPRKSLRHELENAEIPFTLRMAKTKTMVLAFGFSFPFLPVSKQKGFLVSGQVVLVFGFIFASERERVGVFLPPLKERSGFIVPTLFRNVSFLQTGAARFAQNRAIRAKNANLFARSGHLRLLDCSLQMPLHLHGALLNST